MENDKLIYIKPGEIEARSFEMIEEELTRLGKSLPSDGADGVKDNGCRIKRAPVIKRVIHTTADFDYADNLLFSEDALVKAEKLLRSGCVIVTDTNMAYAGINKKALGKLGAECICYMADEDVAREAAARGVTRATVSMERTLKLDRPVIYAIGNAPTALVSIYENRHKLQPGLVIGVPVGFVNVVAAKELIISSDIPYIVARGRKGGSNVAAAIVNALMYQVTDR